VRGGPLEFNPIGQHRSIESNDVSDPDAGNLPVSCPALHGIFCDSQQRGKFRDIQWVRSIAQFLEN
jgi:hypothetical protein